MTCSRIITTTRRGPASAGRLIFTKKFPVVMTTVDAADERDIELRGAFTTGDYNVDRQLAQRPTTTWRTINEMVESFLSGVEFTLYNGLEDAKKISTIIQEHFGDCEEYHKTILGGLYTEDRKITDQRLQELKQLDEFGRYIYIKVRRFGKLDKYNPYEKSKKDFSPLLGPTSLTQKGNNLPDYVPIEERIDGYAGLRSRKRIR